MAYPRDDIDRVRDSTDLVELVAEVTKVKRTGRSVMAVCPFHQEKTPSLSIDPARGLYHCFGCGKSGDIFAWVQETQGADFREAVELLARRAGVTLTEEPGQAERRGRREELIRATRAAVDFYRDRLKVGGDAGGARSYLRGRGYDTDVVAQFELGYSPDGWDELTRHLTHRKFSERTLIDSGLASRNRRGRLTDRFRGRIMFPIFDLRGDPVGFGARLLAGDGPKYLNTAETQIYHKARLLYGLNWAKGEIVRRGESIVVEGYTDVIALHLAGHPVAVATCGTALGEEHLDLLRRFSERVVLAFDADAAGEGAARRGFDIAIPGDLDLRVAALPAGRDPADLVAAGDENLLVAATESSQPLLQFTIDGALAKFDLDEPEARGRAVRAGAALVARYPDPVVRHEYARVISKRTGVELSLVEDAVAAAVREGSKSKAPPPRRARRRRLTGNQKAEQELLRLIMANHPELRRYDIDESLFSDQLHRAAYRLVGDEVWALRPGEPPDLGRIIGTAETEEGQLLTELAMEPRGESSPHEIINRLQVGAMVRRIEELQRSLENLQPDDQGYSDMFSELITLEKQRRRLRSHE